MCMFCGGRGGGVHAVFTLVSECEALRFARFFFNCVFFFQVLAQKEILSLLFLLVN